MERLSLPIVPAWQGSTKSLIYLCDVHVRVWLPQIIMNFVNCRLGEGCSHVVAVMFKVECAVRLGHTSVTSQACKWKKVGKLVHAWNWQSQTMLNYDSFISQLQIEPSIIVDIEFQQPKRGRDIGTPSAPDRQSQEHYSTTKQCQRSLFIGSQESDAQGCHFFVCSSIGTVKYDSFNPCS